MSDIIQNNSRALQGTLGQFMGKVYLWMMMGFSISGLVSYEIANSASLMQTILQNSLIFNVLLIAQLVCVFAFSPIARRCNATIAGVLFLIYCVLTGTTLSVIYFAYTQAAITEAFFITAGSFLALSAYGYVTNRDLGFVGTFCYMGLFGLVIVGLLSLFMPSLRTDAIQLTTAVIGVIVFSGLTAFDTQRIKRFYNAGDGLFQNQNSAAINFALILYLDFINLFLSMLRLLGGRK
jgi:FtsH-binding integral membrane protein